VTAPERFDINGIAAAALRDMAALQDAPASRRGYALASAAVWVLPVSLSELLQADGTLSRIPRVGPSSSRILLEVLASGHSTTVERLIGEHGSPDEIERRRKWREGFLSRAAATEVLALAGADLRARYQGDLQMHSTWSDGADSVQAMAEACARRGYRFAAITDHSGGLPIAGGLAPDRVRAQAAEIDRVNRTLAGTFHVFKGVEANITPDGDVDVAPADRHALDLVVAAPHSGLRSSKPQTQRMLEAVATPGVHILGHPRGRKYDERAGVSADWTAIFAAASRQEVAIELDGDPARQDLDCTLATQALASGCLFALDSDAHAIGELWYAEMAMAHALLAGIPAERIVNCWPLERLREWLASRKRTGGATRSSRRRSRARPSAGAARRARPTE
jgi:putative hydrolase